MEALWGTRLILAGHQNSCNFLTDQKLSLASSNLCSSENGLRLRRMSSPYRGPVCMSFLIPEQRLKKWSVVTRNIPLWQKGSEIRSSWTRRLQWTIQRSEQRKFKNKINPSLVKKKIFMLLRIVMLFLTSCIVQVMKELQGTRGTRVKVKRQTSSTLPPQVIIAGTLICGVLVLIFFPSALGLNKWANWCLQYT